jgi:hypothetical protein
MFHIIHSVHWELNYIYYQHQQFCTLCILMLSVLKVAGTHVQLVAQASCFLEEPTKQNADH